MITIINNPKSETYKQLKNTILSDDFPWYYRSTSTLGDDLLTTVDKKYVNGPFYGHILLSRPEKNKFSSKQSGYFDLFQKVFDEIVELNNLSDKYFFLRSCINCTHPELKTTYSIPHNDHEFDHQNILIYLTDAGGKTYVDDEFHNPSEDDIIIFSGEHYMETPRDKRRIVLISTIATW